MFIECENCDQNNNCQDLECPLHSYWCRGKRTKEIRPENKNKK